MVDVLQRGRNARTGASESQISIILAERPGAAAPRPARTPAPILDQARLQRFLQREYAKLALFPDRSYPWPVGRAHALRLGYPERRLAALPDSAVASFSGLGDPFADAGIRPGETVVDVGSGSGVDALIAAELVGADGRVVGIDLTEELVRKATAAAGTRRRTNVRFERGSAEALPLPDGFADVVLANGVVNYLVPDKRQALREAWRVLKPGGRLVLTDVGVVRAAPIAERARSERWLAGLAGPVPTRELLELLREVGFPDLSAREGDDPFAGSALAEIAREVAGRALLVVARKPSGEPSPGALANRR